MASIKEVVTNEMIEGWAWMIFDYKLEWGSSENPMWDEVKDEIRALDLNEDDKEMVRDLVFEAEQLLYAAAEAYTLPENFISEMLDEGDE